MVFLFFTIFDTYSQSYHTAPDNVKITALEYLEIEHKLAKKIEKFDSLICGPLTKTKAQSENKNAHGVRIRDLQFSCEFEDWE